MRRLRIGMMARGLTEKSGGVREYIREIALSLPALGSGHDFFLYQLGKSGEMRFPGARESRALLKSRLLSDHLEVPLRAVADRLDVLLCTKHVVPPLLRVPAVVVVYDMAYYDPIPELRGEYRRMDALYMRMAMPYSVRRARAVVVPSRFTRDELVRILHIPPEKVAVIPLAVSAAFRPLPAEQAVATARRLGVDGPFVLHTGSLSPRKNVVELLDAFHLLRDNIPHSLVLTAGKSWHDAAVHRRIGDLRLSDRVRILGHVPSADMPALYSAAGVFVYPSLYEGFGLPVLEAMACGCPVVADDAASIPEAAGGAALLVAPHHPGLLAQAILQMVRDPEKRQSCVRAGIARAASTSWTQCARLLLDVLEKAAGRCTDVS